MTAVVHEQGSLVTGVVILVLANLGQRVVGRADVRFLQEALDDRAARRRRGPARRRRHDGRDRYACRTDRRDRHRRWGRRRPPDMGRNGRRRAGRGRRHSERRCPPAPSPVERTPAASKELCRCAVGVAAARGPSTAPAAGSAFVRLHRPANSGARRRDGSHQARAVVRPRRRGRRVWWHQMARGRRPRRRAVAAPGANLGPRRQPRERAGAERSGAGCRAGGRIGGCAPPTLFAADGAVSAANGGVSPACRVGGVSTLARCG